MTDSVHPIRSNINFSEISHFSDWYEDNKDKRFFVLYGSAGSGKSKFVSTRFAFWFVTLKDTRFLIARKTTPSLRKSVYFEIKHILNDWGVDYDENKATMTLHYKDNEMLFTGIDDPEKIKSVELNYAYLEEATEFDHADVLQVNLRMRRRNKNKGESNKLFLLYNPVSANSFLFTKYVNLARSGERTDVAVNHSTYKVNPYLDSAYVQQLLDYEKIDYNYYRIYTLGEPGVLNGLIYENWKICSDMQLNVFNTDPVGIGMDWGYNNPAAACGVWHYDGEIYLKELLYQRKLTQSDIIAKIVNSGEFDTDATYYCDSAEPDRIEDMRRHGLRAMPANKNVLQGINLAKSFRIWVHPESDNLIEELRNYKWKDSKVTDEFLDEPVKAFDHCLSGDTLISTPFGPTPLCELSKGDRVLTGNGSYQRVLWVGVTNPEASVVNLKFSDGSSITGTPDHLVYTLNRGWANLGSLSIFDELVSDSCKSVRPSNRRWDYSTLPDPIPVYNMHVENNHNYYANGILVHNCLDAARYVLSTSPLNRSVVPAKYATAQRGDEGIYSGYDSRFPLKINKPNIRRIPGL